MHGRERVEGLAAKFKFFAVLVVDAEIVLHCVGRRDNVTGILYGRVILQLVDAVALALARSGSKVRRSWLPVVGVGTPGTVKGW